MGNDMKTLPDAPWVEVGATKVYCGQCKWYDAEGHSVETRCVHPSTYRVVDHWFEPVEVSGRCPATQNRHNDCKDFEPKDDAT